MRKFTKEIASLLATVTVGLSATPSTASTEETARMTGQATNPDSITQEAPEELIYAEGVAMLPDDANETTTTTTGIIGTTTSATTTTTTTTTGMIGTSTAPRITTTKIDIPCIGTTITQTETTTTSMIGTSIVTDVKPSTTETEVIPPLMGLIAPADGDANCDGDLDMSDAVLVMQALANPNKYGEEGTAETHITTEGKMKADMNGDGLTVSDAQTIQKKLLGIE